MGSGGVMLHNTDHYKNSFQPTFGFICTSIVEFDALHIYEVSDCGPRGNIGQIQLGGGGLGVVC